VAARLLDFLDAAALLHAALACQYCTPSTCPTMHAGPRAEYRWPADPDAGVVPPTPGGGGGGGGRAAAQPPPSSSSAAAAAAAAAIAPSSAKARRLSAPAYVAALLDWADGLVRALRMGRERAEKKKKKKMSSHLTSPPSLPLFFSLFS
jgi:hypothetical protein